jgi:hypothetical protein
MRVAIVVLVAVLVVGVLWLAGEQHVNNCQSAGKRGCSVLPWSGGNAPGAYLSRSDCQALQRAQRAAGITADGC